MELEVLDLLDVTLAAFGTFLAVVTGFGALVLWRLRRRNRVSRRVRSPAPLAWLWSPTRAARLHRRLQTAVAAAHFCLEQSRGSGLLDDLVEDLERQAVALDQHVVLASRLPAHVRQPVLRELHGHVTELERLVERVATAATAAVGEPPPAALARIAERLDTLQEAQAELARLDVSLLATEDRPRGGGMSQEREVG